MPFLNQKKYLSDAFEQFKLDTIKKFKEIKPPIPIKEEDADDNKPFNLTLYRSVCWKFVNI